MGKFGLASFTTLFALVVNGCDNGSNNAAEYDYEVIDNERDSSAVTVRDTIYDSIQTTLPLHDEVLVYPPQGGDTLAYLSSSTADTPNSSALEVDPGASSGMESSHSSAVEPPKSSSSRIVPDMSSDSRPPRSSSSKMEPPPESSSRMVPPSSSSKEPALDFSFYNGADISTVQEYERWGTKFYDVDGSEKDIFTLLKDHGFNAIRLKTFVSPKAQYGYAASGCDHDAESYADKDHIIAYAQKIKAAGMAFLLDIHYSDNWADPGKQIIPSRWRNVKSSDAMADSVYNYTYDLLNSLKQVNATPEMVQVGNETTPGILIHVPNSKTDCWGNGVDKASTAINGDMGTSAGKVNAGKYFKAGIRAVKAVSQNIKTVLHIESIRKTSTVDWWMNEIFKNQKVPADVMGFSAYTAYGDDKPDKWNSLFRNLISTYPNLEFIVAEYNGGESDNTYSYDGSRKKAVDMVRGLDRWIGAFFWEPTLSGAWGPALFDWDGPNMKANKKAFDEYKVEF
jgi:arabinogalactan endo-1,4-beta-galactosidase